MKNQIEIASKTDAVEILSLQKQAYLSEAEIIDDFTIPPLHQTRDEILSEFNTHTFLKIVMDDNIIGSVRACQKEETCYIGKLIVHPRMQNRGIGSRLLHAAEQIYPDVSRFELFTGSSSLRNLYLYRKYGYTPFQNRVISDKLTLVFMEKPIPRKPADAPQGLKTVSADGHNIAFMEQGQGTPLVLIHGSLSDYRSWDLQMEPFSKHFHTIAISLRHCSAQPCRNGEKNPSLIRQQADCLSAFIKSLTPRPVHLVGHSRGGSLALLLAAGHPDLFRTLVLMDPAPFDTLLPNSAAVCEALEKRSAIVAAAVDRITKGEPDAGLEIFLDAASTTGAWKKLSPAGKQIRRENAEALKTLIADARESFTAMDAANIGMPVLLVTGQNSPPLYGVMHDALAKRLGHFTTARISNASHLMHTDNPKAFNGAVLDFLMTHNTSK